MADLGASAVFGAINTAFKFSEFVIALSEVGSENNVFVRTIQRVRLDLEETERLLRVPSIKLVLLNNPEKLEWMKNAIHSTKCALNDIGLYVERVRADKDRDGEITFGHRVRWVLKDHEKLENRRSELAACHQTLTTVLNTLHPLELMGGFTAVVPPPMPDAPPPAYEPSPDFISPPYRRKKKKVKVETVETTEAESNKETEEMHPTQYWSPPEQKSEIFKCESTGTMEAAPSVVPQGMHQQHIEQFNEHPQPTTQPPLRTPSPVPSLATSYMTSCSSNNHFGPINPWDNWDDSPAHEDRQDVTAIRPSSIHRMSVSSSTTAFLDSAFTSEVQSLPVVPPKIPAQNNFYGAPDPQAYFPPVDVQQQTRSWVAAREPAASIYPLAEMDAIHITELPAETHPTPPRPLNRSLELPVELDVEFPTRKPVPSQSDTTKYMAWNPGVASNLASDQMAHFPPPTAQNPSMPQYRRAYSTPSETTYSTGVVTAMIQYPENAVEMPPAPTQSAYHPYRPRAQTNRNQMSPAPVFHPSRTTSFPASTYQSSRAMTSPAPSFVSAMSQDDDFPPRNLQPEAASQGCTIGRTAVSQSRRRRAMMEAALGVNGD